LKNVGQHLNEKNTYPKIRNRKKCECKIKQRPNCSDEPLHSEWSAGVGATF